MVQDKELSPPKPKSNRANLLWVVKLVVTILILSYIYRTFRNEQKGIGDISTVLAEIWSEKHMPVLIVMLLLVPVNWALESLKWQTLTRKIIPISFTEAFRGTLTGLAVGVAVPAQLGDTLGRVASLKSDRRLEAIGAALISNGIQFYVSVFAGAIGWVFLENGLLMPESAKTAIGITLLLVLLIGPVAFTFRGKLVGWRAKKKVFQKIQQYVGVIGAYTGWDLCTATVYGAIRYLIFLSQFLLALSLFDFPVTMVDLAACVTLVFLAKTLIPAINVLGDLGLREFTALVVFASYHLPAEQIIAATFLIWVLNVLGPILVGIFLIWKYKWKKIKA
ncbi:flippase-like domain-containing protein [Dyadobacter sp. CY261]|uniref:lysylphosphatidylglycerol synthase domain-containing protein n=1 Tax=Dyadobacter sp. CY261 TaxID=2907203 RepID=UPI001F33140F|nr:lysylphosphatidylglycerol synthase domain-containing protein [Dyadobacter sp. CY261]MCF0073823.1 flippase-like domain-containing protein [Dyadobacter sp. CY261]